MRKKTMIIFGISSFIGSNLAHELKDKYRIIGTYFSDPVNIDGILCLHCDVLSKEMVQMITFVFKPDITVYCAGLTSLEDCARQTKLADALNTAGLYNVTTYSERYKAKLIYISSAYVFSGENQVMTEKDTPMPNTFYGRTKVSSEYFIQKSCLNYIIFRCSYLYGRSFNPEQRTFFESLQYCLYNNLPIECDGKVQNGFLDVKYLAKILDECIKTDVMNRLVQVSSKDIMSHFEFAKLYCEVFDENASAVLKRNWYFPEDSGSIKREFTTDDNLYYRLDTSNLELFLKESVPSIKESLENTLGRLGGKGKRSGKRIVGKSTGVTYI